MIPFERYSFQLAKATFEDKDESIEKWITPLLVAGASLQITPLLKGKKISIHKNGADFLIQIDGEEGNFAKQLSPIIDDLRFQKDNFIIEGTLSHISKNDFDVTKMNADELTFNVSDILYHKNTDLLDQPLEKRREILVGKFSDFFAGVNTLVVPFVTVDNSKDIESAINKTMKTIGSIGYEVKLDQSLYTEGCKSNQWCSVGKKSKTSTITKNFDLSKSENKDTWDAKIKKGISGKFTIQRDENILKLWLQPIRPYKAEELIGLTFENIDKSVHLERQFKAGTKFVVGFSKSKIKSENEIQELDSGNFTILKSSNESTVIDFDGSNNVLKGIYNVDGTSKHNFKDLPEIPTDLVYSLSLQDAETNVDKSFGQFTWISKDANISKSHISITKKEGEERFVLGEVLVPEEEDAHGDIYSDEDVRFAAHFFMEKYGNAGLMHQEFINDDAKIVETYIAPVDMSLEASDGSIRKIKKGTWMMAMRIINEDLFADVKAGLLTGFSIGGIATVQELKKLMREYKGV